MVIFWIKIMTCGLEGWKWMEMGYGVSICNYAKIAKLVGGLEHEFNFSIYWE